MSHTVYFRVPLVCTNCHTKHTAQSVGLYTLGLGQDVGDIQIDPGDTIVIDDLDLAESYVTLRPPRADETDVVAIEEWGCPVCNKVQSVRLDFARLGDHRYRFGGASIVALTRVTVDAAHFLSRHLNDWSPNPGDDIEVARVLRDRFAGRR